MHCSLGARVCAWLVLGTATASVVMSTPAATATPSIQHGWDTVGALMDMHGKWDPSTAPEKYEHKGAKPPKTLPRGRRNAFTRPLRAQWNAWMRKSDANPRTTTVAAECVTP